MYEVKLTEYEMFLLLTSLEKSVERSDGERHDKYEALRHRLETIFEGR